MVVSRKDQDTNPIVRDIQVSGVHRSLTSVSAGLTYCAIGALAFLNHSPEEGLVGSDVASSSGISLDECTRWIVGRQTTYLVEEESEADDDETSQPSKPEAVSLPSSPLGSPHTAQFPKMALSPSKTLSFAPHQKGEALILDYLEEDLRYAGFNGRPNKIADTCYCFWNTGALAVRILVPSYYLFC